MFILTAEQMREADRLTTERQEIFGIELMNRAGGAVVEVLRRKFGAAGNLDEVLREVCVLCGKGNNGGDGFVVARLLAEAGVRVNVVLFADPEQLHGDAQIAFQAIRATSLSHPGLRLALLPVGSGQAEPPQWRVAKEQCASASLLVDAVFGTGLKGPVTGFFAEVIAHVNQRPASIPLVAVDTPSGLTSSAEPEAEPGPCIRADVTVTFTAPKWGQLIPLHAADAVGEFWVAEIGTSRETIAAALNGDARSAPRGQVLTAPDLDFLLAPRARESHKGSFGHVLVLGGSLGKAGAVAMASEAALRVGAGLVTAAVPRGIQAIVAGYRPEIMLEPLAETASGTLSRGLLEPHVLAQALAGKNVVAIGPGLSQDAESAAAIRRLLPQLRLPWVLDADGLNAFSSAGELPHAGTQGSEAAAVLTPHPGEMARLLGLSVAEVQAGRLHAATHLADRTGCIVVLKGHRTLIAAPGGQVFVNTTGNPGMATGGAGDVLTGMIAGLLAQRRAFSGVSPLTIVAAAVLLHGAAGDEAAAAEGELPLVATDITQMIGRALRQLRAAAAPSCLLRLCA